MIIRFARIISWLFLPLFIPLYGLLLTMYIIPSEEKILSNPSLFLLSDDTKNQLIVLFLIFGAIAPGVSFILMYKRRLISTLEMDDRKERMIPLFIILSYCVILFLMFYLKAPNGILPKYIYALPITGVLISILFIGINNWMKISLHAAGGGILTGYLCAFGAQQLHFYFPVIMVGFVISGMIMAARLALNKHTPVQVYTGWSIAFFIALFCNIYYPFNLF